MLNGVFNKIQQEKGNDGCLLEGVRTVGMQGKAARITDAGHFYVVFDHPQVFHQRNRLAGRKRIAQMLA